MSSSGRSVGGPPEARADHTARWGFACATAGAILFAAVAGATRNPMSPPLPAGATPIAPLRVLASMLGVANASSWLIGVLAMSAAGLSAAGFAVLAVAAWRGRVSTRAIVWLAVALHALAIVAPVVGSRDVFAYALYGRIVGIHHLNPFTVLPADVPHDPLLRYVDRQWLHTPPVYGPGFIAIAAVLARAFRSPTAVAAAFKFVAAGASLALLALSMRLASVIAPTRRAFTAVMVGVNPCLVFVAVGGGHVDVLIGVVMVGAILIIARRPNPDARTIAAAIALLAAGTLLKFVAGIPLALVIAWDVGRRTEHRARTLLIDVGIGVGVLLAGYAPFAQTHDPTFGLTYLFPFGSLVAPVFFLNKLVVDIVGRIAGTDASMVAALTVRATAGAVFAACLVRIGRSTLARERGDAARSVVPAIAWSLLLVSLSFQWLYAWYVVWFAPLAWALPRRARTAAIVLSAILPLTTATIVDDRNAPIIARGLSQLDFYVVAPCLLVMLAVLVLDLRRDLATPPPLVADDDEARPFGS